MVIFLKSMKEKFYSKLYEERDIRKVAESLCFFLKTSDKVEKYAKMLQSNFSDNYAHHYNIDILNFFDPELQMIKR